MSKHPRPRGICPSCDREIAGRIVKTVLILRAHNKANAGSRAANYGFPIPCPGSGQAAVRRTDPTDTATIPKRQEEG